MKFLDGKILGSMCSSPHPLAWEVYLKYLEKNIGDPGLVPSLVELEQEAVRAIGTFLSHPQASGRIITGGTEANLLALWTARKKAGESKDEVILPATAHFSFDKAASLMGLKLIKIPVSEDFRWDPRDVERAVTTRTLALVGIAGATGLGTVDDIPALGRIALRHGLYLHVDASFGGFVLPFLKDAGYPDLPFDFSVEGVSSIAVDPHKMGRGPIPSGCILYRDRKLADTVTIPVTYLSGGKTHINTVVGTRSGATAAAVWAIVKYLGRPGYVEIVRRAMELTYDLTERLSRFRNLEPVLPRPPLNVVGLRPRNLSNHDLAVGLRSRGWALSQWDSYLRIVVMPHVTTTMIEAFLKDLEEIDG